MEEQKNKISQLTKPVEIQSFWIFTFGVGQKHSRMYRKLFGTVDSTRREMHSLHGTAWSMQYPESKEQSLIDKWGYVELK